MESSRRPPLDRSGELGLKRPRLAEDPNLNNRPFQQRQQRTSTSGATASAASSRLRVNNDRDRDSGESVRRPYQQSNQLQQHQELITQYKAALAELTFNSKPIITNLTIIAGENTHAAKAIAATICANILEVPSEQKLPSLYLLDSIVKNIGRDYIKYFAARLPEVFCKAYRQVDPSIHSGMRHLFGTWKGVFPPQPLQIIERELGFLAAANGSSSASTLSRADSQSQRQPHSIHVNPKYLEARQRLQSSTNVQHPQSEEPGGSGHKKALDAESEDHKYGSGLSRHLTSRLGKSNEGMTDHSYDKQWPTADRGVEEPISSQQNGYNAQGSTPSYTASGSANVHLLPTQNIARRSSRELPRSWKNSEEEEYTWEDLNPRVSDHAAVDNIRKNHWAGDGGDKLEFGGRHTNKLNQSEIRPRIDQEADSLFNEQLPFGHQRTSSWQLQDHLQVQGPDISLSRTGFQSDVGPAHAGSSSFGLPAIAVSGSSGSLVQRHPSPRKPLIPQHSSSSSFSARDPRLNFTEKGQAQTNSIAQPNRKAALFSRPSGMGPHNPTFQDSFPGVHQNLHLENTKKSEPPPLQRTVAPVSSFHSKQYNPPMQQPVKQLGSPSGILNPDAEKSPDKSSTSPLLIAARKSGIPPGSLTDYAQPSLLSGPSQASVRGPRLVSSSSSRLPHDLVSLLSQREMEKPSPSPGPPLSSSLSSTATSDGTTSGSNPFSSLLNTLVAKGLISSSKAESATSASPPLSLKLDNQNPSLTTTSRAEVTTPSVSSITPLSTTEKLASSEPAGHISDATPRSSETVIENLIGYEFRPDILRQFHSTVVDGLFDVLPHQCSICGLRLKLKERLDRHLDWHALKQSEQDPDKLNMPSKRWFANSEDWVTGKAELSFGSKTFRFLPESIKASEDGEPMVPADESQCVCLLCGELFEDFYSQERDEWMFKGAVYMAISSGNGNEESSSQTTGHGIIAHAKCMTDDAVNDFGLTNVVKLVLS